MGKVTLSQIAREANVSIGTVSAVLNNYTRIKRETRTLVLDLIKKHKYTQNPAALMLVSGRRFHPVRQHLFSFVIPSSLKEGFATPAIAKIASGVMAEAGAGDATFVTEVVKSDYRYAVDTPRSIRNGTSGGVIFVGQPVDSFITQMIQSGVPVVLAETSYDARPVHSILVDNIHAAFTATEYLFALGHRHIALIKDDSNYFPTGRYEGYRLAHEKHGIKLDPSGIIGSEPNYQGGFKAAKEMMERGVRTHYTALFCMNDEIALGAMVAFQQAGIHIPDDISIIGYDDFFLSRQVSPALTTMRPPLEMIGRKAARRLMELIEGREISPSKELVFAELVVRQSVKKLLT